MSLKRTLLDLKADLAPDNAEGFLPTTLPGAQVFFTDRPMARSPLSYEPGIAIIVSGHKTGYFDDRQVRYGPGQYLAVGLPLVFECETVASPDEPMLGLFLNFEPQMLRNLARDIDACSTQSLPSGTSLGIEPLTMPDAMMDTAGRLVRQLSDPAQTALLAPATLREVFFHALHDRHGHVLLAQTRENRPEARIAQVVRDMNAQPEAFDSVQRIAEAAGMSPASLHRHFKATTGLAPLQYLKRQRLMRAKSLLAYGGLGVSDAAHRVGYASQSQFSRDFRRYFDMPPSRVSAQAAT